MARKKKDPGEEPTVPATARPAYDAIVALTDAFCREHLDGEYEALCRKLAGASGPQATVTLARRQADDLGLRDRPHDRLGELPGRP